MGESQQPFIWIPVAENTEGQDGQLKSSGAGAMASSSVDASLTGEKRKIAPISRENLEEMVRGFEGYEVETIELNVVGGIETGGILQFIVAGKAEAGMTVTLKKKDGKSGQEK